MPSITQPERSSLAVELKKRLPFESPLEESLMNLFRTQTVLAARVEATLKTFKLSNAKYNVLRILRGVSLHPEPIKRMLPSLEVAERMITRVPDITRLVDGLIANGLVRRARCTQDRRVVYVGITAKGRRRVDALDRPMAELHQKLLGSFSAADFATMNGLLDKIRTANASLDKDFVAVG